MNYPKISVIIPSFNQGVFIEETLKSLISQKYPDLEIIVIDGGSTDQTVKILEKYDEHIHYWCSEKDDGQSDAINKGLQIAKGDWISFLNSDDLYLPGFLLSLFSSLNEKHTTLDFIYGYKGKIGKNPEIARDFEAKNIKKLKLSTLLRFFYSVDYIIPSQSVLMSRELVKQVGFFNQDLHYCMDLDYYLRCALCKPSYYVYHFPSFFYRVDEHTKTTKYKEQMFEEAVVLAHQYKSNISFVDRIQLANLISFEKRFRVLRKYEPKDIHFTQLITTFKASYYHALQDKRYLGLWKLYLKKAFNFA